MRDDEVGEARVGIVGGSIAGLGIALVLDRVGVALEIFERVPRERWSSGAGVGLDPELLTAITGQAPVTLPHLTLRERQTLVGEAARIEAVTLPVTAHHLLREHLAALLGAGRLRAAEAAAVRLVGGGRRAEVELTSGEREVFDLVLGADGARSRVRDVVVGAPTPAPYAGYLHWRGVIAEAALDEATRALFFEPARLTIAPHPRQLFSAYPVPGPGGEVEAGSRRLSWGWFYGATEARAAAVEPEARASAAPAAELEELGRMAGRLWPAPVRAVIERSLASDEAWVAPVRELAAPRLARGCVGLVGDAAHVISPVSGGSARAALYDALLLARLLVDAPDLLSGLAAYESRRLPVIRALVEQGRSLAWGFRLE